MNNKDLNKVRKKIDLLDKKLLILIKTRTNLVKQVIKLKKYKKQIVDHRRIGQILRNIKKRSQQNKVDPKITARIWKSMIWAYVDFQKRNFKKK